VGDRESPKLTPSNRKRTRRTTMTPTDVAAKVIEILKAEFPLLASMELEADTALLSAGLLDSFALVMLLATLEEEFGLELDVESVPLEQFETPTTIARLCLGEISSGEA
jgi:acyl carrier protein